MLKKIDEGELLRGAEEVIGWNDVIKKMRAGKKLRIKHGWDPTAPDLHLGYSVVYRIMRRFQDLGHKVVFLVGDFTATVGDPTDKDKTRPRLEQKAIRKNLESGLKQIGKILDLKKTEIRHNSEWWAKFRLKNFLELASKVSAARLWERDMFERRLEKGESVMAHEFLYPILQGYDSVMLKSDLTVIGTDQKFNELVGRQIQQDFGQDPQGLIMMPILRGTDGKMKMSQSLGNYIGISEPEEEQFGKIMSIPDELLREYFKLLTEKDPKEVESSLNDPKTNPRDLKMELAYLIVSKLSGDKSALKAKENFVNQFQKGLVKDAPKVKIGKKEINIVDALLISGLALSKSEARRVISQMGVSYDEELMLLPEHILKIDKGGKLLRKGRHYRILVP